MILVSAVCPFASLLSYLFFAGRERQSAMSWRVAEMRIRGRKRFARVYGRDVVYTENSWGIAVWRVLEKRARLDAGVEEIGVIAPKVFQTRSLRRVLAGRNDPPTHSCRRSVVDDNGNPIFRNNICLEDRRLTSPATLPGVCTRACVCACGRV